MWSHQKGPPLCTDEIDKTAPTSQPQDKEKNAKTSFVASIDWPNFLISDTTRIDRSYIYTGASGMIPIYIR